MASYNRYHGSNEHSRPQVPARAERTEWQDPSSHRPSAPAKPSDSRSAVQYGTFPEEVSPTALSSDRLNTGYFGDTAGLESAPPAKRPKAPSSAQEKALDLECVAVVRLLEEALLREAQEKRAAQQSR
eukprot:RCo032181